MSSFKLFQGLLFFSFFYITVESDPNFLYNFCYDNDTTIATNSSSYKANLNLLLSSFSSKSNSSDGYYNTTAGQQTDKIYGMFLCRGDVTYDVCRDCVTAAAQNVTRLCSVDRSSVIWYDECMLRYSNQSFFSTQVSRPSVLIWENKTVTGDKGFIDILASLVRDVSTAAADAPVGAIKFATKEAKFNGSQTLYSLAQCTPDLSNFDCNLCLQTAITDFSNCCAPNQGATRARSMLPSCNIQYGLFPFYNKTAGEAPESEPSPSGPRNPGKDKNSSQTLIYILVPTLGFLAVVSTFCYCVLRRKSRKTPKVPKDQNDTSKSITMQSLQFDLSAIEEATNSFSDVNKIGMGGFGSVYKGVLANGQEIAVKRLSRSSKQGAVEFKNEMVLVAKLQHRNLVRLLGFCVEGEERMLVYEFMPNKSLDYFLFDSEKKKQLDWSIRHKIIKGTARGLLYLHMDSRLKIIHRDLKPSNVLLDGDMNPRISDFGMARIVEENEDIEQTRKVVGTYGYISPEYALQGMFSFKSDVYSFGVLTLEMVSGRRNTSFCNSDHAEDLLSFAWRNWKEGTPLEIMDTSLGDSFVSEEVIKCIQIGLLCVQQNPKARPTMAKIVAVLSSSAVSLPPPQQPAFLFGCKTAGNSSMEEMKLNESTSKSKCSVNQVSYSEFHPR